MKQIASEETYQIAAMGVHGLRVEIVSGGPGPEDEAPCVSCRFCTAEVTN